MKIMIDEKYLKSEVSPFKYDLQEIVKYLKNGLIYLVFKEFMNTNLEVMYLTFILFFVSSSL